MIQREMARETGLPALGGHLQYLYLLCLQPKFSPNDKRITHANLLGPDACRMARSPS